MIEDAGKTLRRLTAEYDLGQIDLSTYRRKRAAVLDALICNSGAASSWPVMTAMRRAMNRLLGRAR